jgi:hypothetical protein
MNTASHMDRAFENWSLPWQALQRSLAMGIEAASGATTERVLNPQKATQSAESWLGRARRRLEPMPMS